MIFDNGLPMLTVSGVPDPKQPCQRASALSATLSELRRRSYKIKITSKKWSQKGKSFDNEHTLKYYISNILQVCQDLRTTRDHIAICTSSDMLGLT